MISFLKCFPLSAKFLNLSNAAQPGESKTVTLKVNPLAFSTVNEAGERVADDDTFDLYVGLNGPDARSVELTGHTPVSLTVTL
mgnify:CR=1 FL=1